MKFARYLDDSLTPEWKRAYIDYRALKKHIAAIKQQHRDDDHDDVHPPRSLPLPPTPSFSPSQPLHVLLASLPPQHIAFFSALDAELDKIDSFYAAREQAMADRGIQLRIQLTELKDHRRLYHESHALKSHLSLPHFPHLPPRKHAFPGLHHVLDSDPPPRSPPNGVVDTNYSPSPSPPLSDNDDDGPDVTLHSDSAHSPAPLIPRGNPNSTNTNGNGNKDAKHTRPHHTTRSPHSHSRSLSPPHKHPLDPQEYQHARKKLKKAVVEHYRGLEVLNNYRILNLTGFRKALKKYEKVTRVPAQSYMHERVEPSAFASGAKVNGLLKEMEELFAVRFERGDKKKALVRLRAGSQHKSHHFSTFRSGAWLGLALPPFVVGSFLAAQPSTPSVLPAWSILLYIYSVLLIPLLFSLMVGTNVLVWARERVNYVFIFELDTRTRLDHREYFELPSMLLCLLSYAYFLSLARIGPPLLWPLVWLLVVAVILLNPIRRVFWGSTRWWLLKSVGRLGASGFWRVEFTDFWLGDQFCSLVYSLANLYFVGCVYARYFPSMPSPPSSSSSSSLFFLPSSSPSSSSFPATPHTLLSSAYDPRIEEAWDTCGTSSNWGYDFFLGSLPFLWRFVQSLRRYGDSRLGTHLINAGKYGMGLVYYFFYYYWRHNGNKDGGVSFVLWCLSGTVYSIYACTWDILMDWSFMKPHARYPLLRDELIYTDELPLYYVALLTNVLIRFIWVIYIPSGGINLTARTFIAAMLEMLRRWQWNFFRLENEHLGNMDQYRVTREVPLPYTFDGSGQANDDEDEDDGDGEGDENGKPEGSGSSWLRRRLTRNSSRVSDSAPTQVVQTT